MGFYTLPLLLILLLTAAAATVKGNIEGDVLFAWKKTLHDPKNVLQSWDPTLANPCFWSRVTCNSRNNVVRVDLGEGALAGHISPDLAKLTQLQYLELYSNNFTGRIPPEFGKLKHLRSLDLYKNRLSGSIPASLGNLKSLMFLRVNNNALTGCVPTEIFELVRFRNLKIIDVSRNFLAGSVRPRKSKGIVKTTILQDPPGA